MSSVTRILRFRALPSRREPRSPGSAPRPQEHAGRRPPSRRGHHPPLAGQASPLQGHFHFPMRRPSPRQRQFKTTTGAGGGGRQGQKRQSDTPLTPPLHGGGAEVPGPFFPGNTEGVPALCPRRPLRSDTRRRGLERSRSAGCAAWLHPNAANPAFASAGGVAGGGVACGAIGGGTGPQWAGLRRGPGTFTRLTEPCRVPCPASLVPDAGDAALSKEGGNPCHSCPPPRPRPSRQPP